MSKRVRSLEEHLQKLEDETATKYEAKENCEE
jgi:hypothetical protein